MKKFSSIFIFLVLLTISGTLKTYAQRPMEKLDRSVVAQKVANGVFVNWRIPADEWYNTSYKLYRDGSLIYTGTASDASNFLDTSGTINSKYSVSSVKNGVESQQSKTASVLPKSYLEIPLRDIKKLGKTIYYPNDATSADLDGDGEMEVIIKRMNRNWDIANTNYTYFEAYKLNGTFLWAIDVGPNICMDVEINIAAFDFDGDGKAEVFMRSSDNTIFGLDINNENGVSVGDRDGDGYTNYRQAPFNGIGGDGFMNAGPEYLSLIDGMTGKELDWVNFIPRVSSDEWGDGYGHRANKFFFGAPYLDGKKPSLFIGRGIYTQTKMQTYDVVNKKLIPKWYWEATTKNSNNMQKGKWDDGLKNYFGQGYHNYTIADVDDDGRDEINWGSMSVDDDGKPLYSTELGHGDAQHYGDFDPYRKGQEMAACNETKPGTNMRDAKTGKILYRHITTSDCGRVGVGNISDASKGTEMWGAGVGISCTDRIEGSHFGVAESNCMFWDGDLLQEICDHSGFSTSTGVGYGAITKFNGYGNITTLLSAEGYSCNYTKGTPCLQADIMGDWREEAIWWRYDSLAVRIYTTPFPTTNRIYTLLHDHQYRQAVCWQMCGYNQPPHTSFYLGSDFPTPVPPKTTNGKLVWNGTDANLNTTSANFVNGDDAAGLYAGNAVKTNFFNGKSILFDERASIKNLNINSDLQPEVLYVAGNDNYSLGGNGKLTGNMRLEKMGEGVFTLSGEHTYTGNTEIWEGSMSVNGSLTASPVVIKRHASFGGKVNIGTQLTTEFNATVYPGGNAVSDSMKIAGNLSLVTGARLVVDLSDNPEIPLKNAVRSSLKNDYIEVNGSLQLGSGSILLINQIGDSLTEGKYLIMKANSISGNLSTMKIQGAGGKSVALSYDSNVKGIYLTVTGTRSAGSVSWSGKTDNNWNIAKTANWNNDGYADIFVSNDSVTFDDSGINRSVNLGDSLIVSNMLVNNSQNYTFAGTGVITGPMSLVKSGPGALYLNSRNSYTGKTLVNEGSLIMQYAPSSISNGGIGTNITDAAYLVVRDSALIQVNTANEQTNRGLTFAGEAGGLMNVTNTLYWNGIITGTKLTKLGTGTLMIGNNNSTLNETVLKAGTIKINATGAVPYGVGKKITILGGTLETINSIGSYLTSSHNIDVPEGYTGKIIAGARCEYNGVLTGAGTLNWVSDYIRCYINGNWSGFSGRINITSNGSNSDYEDKFIVNNAAGFPNATVNLASSGLIMCYKNGTADNGTTTIKTGMLTGAAGTVFHNAGLEVGALNTNGTYAGIFTGIANIKKVGTGLWILSGANTNTGTLTISSGTINVTGSIGTGTVTVANTGTLNLSGTGGGSAIVSSGGILNITGTLAGSLSNTGILKGTGKITGASIMSSGSEVIPASTQLGTLSFGSSVVLKAGSKLSIQVNGGSANLSDKLSVTGTLTCAGTLDISINSGVLVEGAVYKVLEAASVSGTFDQVTLAAAGAGLAWDLTGLYVDGTVKVIKDLSAVDANVLKSGLLQNPANGIFRVQLENTSDNILVKVSDLNGKVIYQEVKNAELGILKIDLTTQASGVYMMEISTEDGKTATHKLIKK